MLLIMVSGSGEAAGERFWASSWTACGPILLPDSGHDSIRAERKERVKEAVEERDEGKEEREKEREDPRR